MLGRDLVPSMVFLIMGLSGLEAGLGNWCDQTVFAEGEKKRAEAAQAAYEYWAAEYFAGRYGAGGCYTWSFRLMEAETDRNSAKNSRRAAAQAHLARMIAVAKHIRSRVAAGRVGIEAYLAADYYQADAEFVCRKAGMDTVARQDEDVLTTCVAAALMIYEHWWCNLGQRGRENWFLSAVTWSIRWLEAELERYPKSKDRLAIVGSYLNRIRELEKQGKLFVNEGMLDVAKAHYTSFCRLDAELMLQKLKAGRDNGDEDQQLLLRNRLDTAKIAYETGWKGFISWVDDPEQLFEYSRAWLKAALSLSKEKADQTAACEAHVSRMKELQRILNERVEAGRVPARLRFSADYYRAAAEVLLSKTKNSAR